MDKKIEKVTNWGLVTFVQFSPMIISVFLLFLLLLNQSMLGKRELM
jgi:hypothetical protein